MITDAVGFLRQQKWLSVVVGSPGKQSARTNLPNRFSGLNQTAERIGRHDDEHTSDALVDWLNAVVFVFRLACLVSRPMTRLTLPLSDFGGFGC